MNREEKEEGKLSKERKMWIPRDIAKLMQGVKSLDELKTKLSNDHSQEDDNTMEPNSDLSDETHQMPTAIQDEVQDIRTGVSEDHEAKDTQNDCGDREEPWIKVTLGKSARRNQPRTNSSNIIHIPNTTQSNEATLNASIELERDGNPTIPSVQ